MENAFTLSWFNSISGYCNIKKRAQRREVTAAPGGAAEA
jgi:hypothetical protein